MKVDKVQVNGAGNTTFAVCLDQDEKKILQSVTRCGVKLNTGTRMFVFLYLWGLTDVLHTLVPTLTWTITIKRQTPTLKPKKNRIPTKTKFLTFKQATEVMWTSQNVAKVVKIGPHKDCTTTPLQEKLS